MKIAKLIIAGAALAATSSAHSTTLPVYMNATNFSSGVNGNLVFADFMGSWNSDTGQGSWSGHAFVQPSPQSDPTVAVVRLDLHFNQTFFMDATTGVGLLDPLSIASCYDNLSGASGYASAACAGFSPSFAGDIYNTIGNTDLERQTPISITPDYDVMTWTLQIYAGPLPTNTYVPVSMNVCASVPQPEEGYSCTLPDLAGTPLPATAWLFGSGLIGWVGLTRRMRATK